MWGETDIVVAVEPGIAGAEPPITVKRRADQGITAGKVTGPFP